MQILSKQEKGENFEKNELNAALEVIFVNYQKHDFC